MNNEMNRKFFAKQKNHDDHKHRNDEHTRNERRRISKIFRFFDFLFVLQR